MNRIELNILIAQAKNFGDEVWGSVERFSARVDQATKSQCYDRFATVCDALERELGGDKKLAELLMLETFLRAGKHMPADIKIKNRTRADTLIEEILKQ